MGQFFFRFVQILGFVMGLAAFSIQIDTQVAGLRDDV
jgi:hypothetical protein